MWVSATPNLELCRKVPCVKMGVIVLSLVLSDTSSLYVLTDLCVHVPPLTGTPGGLPGTTVWTPRWTTDRVRGVFSKGGSVRRDTSGLVSLARLLDASESLGGGRDYGPGS